MNHRFPWTLFVPNPQEIHARTKDNVWRGRKYPINSVQSIDQHGIRIPFSRIYVIEFPRHSALRQNIQVIERLNKTQQKGTSHFAFYGISHLIVSDGHVDLPAFLPISYCQKNRDLFSNGGDHPPARILVKGQLL
jgi:hypothetical protein